MVFRVGIDLVQHWLVGRAGDLVEIGPFLEIEETDTALERRSKAER